MASPASTLHDDTASTDARLRPAFAALERGDFEVLSLDVFDTLLWRKVPRPRDAFPLIGERLRARGLLAPGISAATFGILRGAAEERARAQARAAGEGVEVTLDEVWAQVPRSVLVGDPVDSELVALECDVERDLLVADLDVVALAQAVQRAGRRVIGVSDTYFSERQLRLFIARGALADVRIDRLFASSAHRAGKGSGLWSIVLRELGCSGTDVLHVGDNHAADVLAPQAHGIATVYFRRCPPVLERIVEREVRQLPDAAANRQPGDGGLTALRGKTLARTEGERQPAGLRDHWDYGAATLGPALAGFAEWVQERTAAAGCSKAFCLMREGELLAQLVRAARPAEGGVDAEPIWLSRQVVARAAIRDGSREELKSLFVRRRLPTLREFCATLGLSLDDLPDLAARADQHLDDAGFGDEAIDRVVFDSQLRATVVAGAQALRRRIVRYVEARLPAGETTLTLVDLGWGATIQAHVERLLAEGGVDCRTLGLYLITGEPATGRVLDGVDAQGFLAALGEPVGAVDAIMRSPEILEQVCMPDHGSQVGLTSELQPVLAGAVGQPLQSVERAAVQQGIAAFQREWQRYREAGPGAVAPLADCTRERLLATLVRAVAAPTAGEAELFAEWLHDENFGSDRVETIVAGPAARALRHVDPASLVDIPMTELYWPFGLAALQDEVLAEAIAAAVAGKVPWEALSSKLETGDFEIFADLGWGFAEGNKYSLKLRRNRLGLSLAKATVRGDFIQRLRLDPAKAPCIVRLDFISLRCRLHSSSEIVSVHLESAGELAAAKVIGAREIAPKLLLVTGDDPHLVLDLRKLIGDRVYECEVECAFALLPLARSQARERFARVKHALRSFAKENRFGAPLRLAGRAVKRLRR